MREKIASYLEKAGRPLPPGRILREALNILSPNALVAESVLKRILGKDPRFRKRMGLWGLVAGTPPRMPENAALYLQWSARRPCCFRGSLHFPGDDFARDFRCAENDPHPVAARSLRSARMHAGDRLLLAWSAKEIRMWNRLRTWYRKWLRKWRVRVQGLA